MERRETKLLTVEDSFLIEDRGVIVLPMIEDYSGPTSVSVILRKPSGEESLAKAQLSIPTMRPRTSNFLCTIAEISKQDVPIGTEILISHK
jgi:hypothetical protein